MPTIALAPAAQQAQCAPQAFELQQALAMSSFEFSCGWMHMRPPGGCPRQICFEHSEVVLVQTLLLHVLQPLLPSLARLITSGWCAICMRYDCLQICASRMQTLSLPRKILVIDCHACTPTPSCAPACLLAPARKDLARSHFVHVACVNVPGLHAAARQASFH